MAAAVHRDKGIKQAYKSLREVPLPLWILFINSFTMAIGFFMLIPLLALHLLDQLALGATLVGLIIGVRSFCQQGLMILGGIISDRVGYKQVICCGVFVRAIGFILFGFAEEPLMLVLAAFLSGLGGALFHPSSYALYTVLSNMENRSFIYSIREMLSNTGFVFGPVIGAFLLSFNFQWVCMVAGFMFVIVFLVTLFCLPKLENGGESKPVLENMSLIMSKKVYVLFCLKMTAVWFLVVQLYLAVPVKMQMLGLDQGKIGIIYTTGALVVVFTQVPAIHRLSKHISTTGLLSVGTAFITGGLGLIGWSTNFYFLCLGVITFSIGQMFLQPMISKRIAELAPISQIGSFYGFNGLALAIGGVLGNMLGGFLFDFSLKTNLSWIPWVVFMLVGCLALWRLISRTEGQASQSSEFLQ